MSYAAYISSALFVISWAGVRPGDAPILYASVGRIYANMSFVFKYIHEAEVYTIPHARYHITLCSMRVVIELLIVFSNWIKLHHKFIFFY